MFKIRNMFNEFENINNLSNADLFNLIYEIVEIQSLSDKNEAISLINYLTDCPTPIREAVSYKLEEIIPEYPNYFQNDLVKLKLIDAISDINPNVSRCICNVIQNNEFIAGMLVSDIIKRIDEIIENIRQYEKEHSDFFQNRVKNKKNHAKNKLLFALYWYMEALSNCNIDKYEDKIIEILNYTFTFCDYTIREKTAKLLKKLDNPPKEILQKAKTDENFYVKIQLYDKISLKT